MENFLLAAFSFLTFLALSFFLFFRKTSNKAAQAFLNRQRVSVPLIDKVAVSHDTRRFRFGLPAGKCLGLPVGQHITVYAPNKGGCVQGQWNGKDDPEAGEEEVQRKYTPTSSNEDLGFFELVIKVYAAGVKTQFPDGGKMSQYLESLKVGVDSIDMAGPFGRVAYRGQGQFDLLGKPLPPKTHVGLLAGGTGLTPMLQVISSALKNPQDSTRLSLIYANQTQDDILLRDHLETLAAKHPHQFSLHFTLDTPPANWSYSSGFITQEMIKDYLPPPGENTVVLMCGPPPMVKFACQANLDALGYAKVDQLTF